MKIYDNYSRLQMNALWGILKFSKLEEIAIFLIFHKTLKNFLFQTFGNFGIEFCEKISLKF